MSLLNWSMFVSLIFNCSMLETTKDFVSFGCAEGSFLWFNYLWCFIYLLFFQRSAFQELLCRVGWKQKEIRANGSTDFANGIKFTGDICTHNCVSSQKTLIFLIHEEEKTLSRVNYIELNKNILFSSGFFWFSSHGK